MELSDSKLSERIIPGSTVSEMKDEVDGGVVDAGSTGCEPICWRGGDSGVEGELGAQTRLVVLT